MREKKNVIVVMLDTLQFNYLGCYGNTRVKTPNIDRFATEGVVFENAYTEGLPTVPCRRAMLTGRYTLPVKGWSQLDVSDTTIADLCWGQPIDSYLIHDSGPFRLPKFGYSRGFDKVFFTNAGADANENAMRAARLFTGRDKILSSYRCYHGNTGAAISATGDWRRKPNDYSRGHVHFFTPYLYRSEFSATTQEEECERALAHLEHVIQFEGPDTIAAVLLESVPGTAGIIIPPKDYFKGVREITKKYSILMITDEVMAGFGRTGFWFALDDYDYTPDIISFAKGCNSGYVPAGGVIMSDPVAHRFDDIVFPGGLTYSGHPLAMGAIVATQEAMEEEHIVDNAYTIGKDVLGPQLTALYDKHPKIGEVRGKGVFWAVEMVADRTTKEPLDDATMKQIVAEGDKRGLILGVHNNRIHVTPPCVISADEATQGVEILDQVLTAAGC